jgi:hypothetical protein
VVELYAGAPARAVALHPGFDVDFERGVADALDLGVNAENIAYLDRAYEMHTVQRHCDHPALCAFTGADARSDIHLRQYPAAEDVAGRIGIGRHRDGAGG